MSVIHLDAFLQGVHLLPIFGSDFLPINFDYTQTLNELLQSNTELERTTEFMILS